MRRDKKFMTGNGKKTKILAVNFGGIGDEILFLPTLKTLKALYPDSVLTLVVEPRSRSIKSLTSLIDEIITCDIKGESKYSNVLKLLFKIWAGKYDLVISSGSSKMVTILLFLTGIRKRFGYDTGLLSKILLTKTALLNKNQYAVGMYHDLTKTIDNGHEAGLPEINVFPDDLDWANGKIGEKTQKQIIAIHPGVSKLSVKKNMLKFWSAENWVELIFKLLNSGKYKVMLTGGPDDEEILSRIKADLVKHNVSQADLIDMWGQTGNISQLAALINLSDLLVSVDSAPMHIGVGVKTPVVAIFGPTDEKKLLPLDNKRFISVKNDNIECRPCLWDKRQTSCDNPECLKIASEQVFQAIERQLGK